MRAALAVLGYGQTHHIGHVMANPAEVDAWNAAIDAKFHAKGKQYGCAEWDQLLGEFKVFLEILSFSLYNLDLKCGFRRLQMYLAFYSRRS
jgi:hypothetical protein